MPGWRSAAAEATHPVGPVISFPTTQINCIFYHRRFGRQPGGPSPAGAPSLFSELCRALGHPGALGAHAGRLRRREESRLHRECTGALSCRPPLTMGPESMYGSGARGLAPALECEEPPERKARPGGQEKELPPAGPQAAAACMPHQLSSVRSCRARAPRAAGAGCAACTVPAPSRRKKVGGV